jgi:uncharacterized protein
VFEWIAARRLIVLMGIGLAHAMLIWYGDILFIYAVTGLAVMALVRRVSTVAVFTLGAVLFFISVGQGWLMAWLMQSSAAPAAGGEAFDPTVMTWFEGLKECGFNPMHPMFAQVEAHVYGEGPFTAAVGLRAFQFFSMVVFAGLLAGFFARTAAMFLIGAALLRWRFFDQTRRAWHLAFCLIGLAAGGAIEGWVAWSTYEALSASDRLGADVAHQAGSLLLSMGYVGTWLLVVHSRVFPMLAAGFAAVGRTALTNYLLQSLTATFIMYWWGLGLFGEVSRFQQVVLVALIYMAQVALSVLWLKRFTMGPGEWTWRTITYLSPQPLLRR